ncbi:hypothetical protein OA92_04025 [Marinomonas sp. SBI22]|uniref:condensation domain-containing protein n=1 Tax=unclassified Marinomonas TaxID=196814 RepID=UPI0007AF749E|nr:MULTISPECIES: condensation domain-containing protein [unclassified Marinomonas]KZM45032.1 hypothetical protein OA92_04025 [Marinomonas sp. SBI22]KZM46731.1 hypothetical protein OA91_03085 [Marinomonas sp. SBI8L]
MNEGLILDPLELSEFEKEIASLGLIDESQAIDTTNQLKNNGQLSLSEERAWMLHQQDPLSSAGPFTAAFKLSGALDAPRLINALKKIYQGNTNLNQIYKLDEEGELIKRKLDPESIIIEEVAASDDEEVINFLLEQQKQPLDLAKDAAIKFWLFNKTENEYVLGLLGHHILLDDTAWQPIFNAISSHYKDVNFTNTANTKQIEQAQQNTNKLESYWANTHPNGLNKTQLPSLFFKAEGEIPLVKQVTSHDKASQVFKANRFYSRTSTTKADALAQASQTSPFQALLTLFGLYLNQLLDQTSVDIIIPIVDHQEITGLDQIKSSSNVIPVRIENTDIQTAILNLRNNLLNGMSNNLSIEQIFSATKSRRNDLPNILVTQVDDASDYLTLDGIRVSNLTIPPISSDYDLTLAIQFEQNDHIRFELTTGDLLSPTIGHFLLEQFIGFIDKAEIDSKRVIPSLFTSSNNNFNNLAEVNRTNNTDTKSSTNNHELIKAIIEEFKTVLDQNDISANDDFFELGGHSLLATRVIGKLKSQHQIEVKIADFFNAPTAIGLAEHATKIEEQDSHLAQVGIDQEIIVPHTYVQNTWMDLIELGKNPIFNIPFTLKFAEEVDEKAFHKAFTNVLMRHDALRTLLLPEEDGTVLQRIIPTTRLDDYQWFFSSATQGNESAENLLAFEANYSFDLINEIPVRVRFLHNEKGEHFLSLLIYHMTFDEWSAGILISDLFFAYKEYVNGVEPKWETVPAQFHQYVSEQTKESEMEQELEFWKQQLGKVPPARPLFYQDGAEYQVTDQGSWIEFSFGKDVADGLNHLAKSNKSSMFHVVFSAFSLALYYLGASKKITIGTSAFGRDNPKFQDTVGLFTNVVMNQVQFDEELSINQLVCQVKETIISSLAHSNVPFVTVEHTVAAKPEELATDNLCEVYIQYHQKNVLNTAIELNDGHSVGFDLLEPERSIAKFGLHFEAYEDPNSIEAAFRVVLAYRMSSYSQDQVELIKSTTQTVIESLANQERQADISIRDVRRALANKGL